MQLIVMRHGQAGPYTEPDAERALTTHGRSQARAAAAWLKARGIQPRLLWVSPYVRAQQTADAVQSTLGPVTRQTQAHITPEDEPGALLSALEAAGDGIMLVSHNPFVSSLIGLLVEADESRGPAMETASVAVLEGDFWEPGCCRIQALWHERDHRDGR